MMKTALAITVSLWLSLVPALGQKGKKMRAESNKTSTVSKIENITKKCQAFPGLFPLYQDTTSGKTYIQVHRRQLNQEFIYFSHVVDGVADAGLIRGAYRGSRIFTIRRYFNKLEFVGENTGYYFDPENPLSRAAKANINQPVLASPEILAMDDSTFLVKADGIFLTESFQQVKPSPTTRERKNPRWSLGKLKRTKSRYRQVRNYLTNTDVVVELVYEEPYPVRGTSRAVTDPRSVSVRVQHSLIQVPDNDFEARRDDPRIGYFSSQVTDMTSPIATPYRDVIHRWDLKKMYPDSALSIPVSPITWWIENTTPYELRPIIKAGVLQWNKAFEAIGFRDAIVVKEQPEDADWDAGDLRYNVLRWTSSPNPRFGGYGPSFVHPRTGQILGADIMLEYIYLTNRLRTEKLFEITSLDGFAEDDHHFEDGHHRCDFSLQMHYSTLMGREVIALQGQTEEAASEFLKQSLYRLVLHEVGHTLGLTHNFMASNLHAPEDLNNSKLTEESGLTGSVMEYPAINISLDPEKQGQYFDVRPGLYDNWVIDYGYSPKLADASAEAMRMEDLLSRSTEPALAYGNDADDMRSPGRGIDPRRMIFDLSSDPVAYSLQRLQLVEQTYPKLIEKYTERDQSYHELRNAYLVLTREQSVALSVISRQIGGVYVNRAFPGQDSSAVPYEPVPYGLQKQAMKELSEHAFGPDALAVPNGLYQLLQPQRRGFNHFRRTEDPRIHQRVITVQKGVLDHLMHPVVLQRITDSERYGNKYALSEMFTDLSNAVFQADWNGSVNSFRQNLQQEYIKRLLLIVTGEKYHTGASSMALFELNRIKRLLESHPGGNVATLAHRRMLAFRIEQGLASKP